MFLGSLTIAGFFVAFYFIFSACRAYPDRYIIYWQASPFFIFLNGIILTSFFVFGQAGLWVFISFSAILTFFAALSINAPSLNYQIAVFLAEGFLVTIFRNSVIYRGLSIDRQIDNLQEERNSLEAEYLYTQGASRALKDKVERYSMLKDLTGRLNSTLSLDAVADIVVNKVYELIDRSDICLLFLVEEGGQELALKIARSKSGPISIKSKKGDIFDLWVLKQRQPLLVFDSGRDFRFNLNLIPEEFRRESRSLILAPFISERKMVGVLRVESKDAEAYTSDDLRVLSAISDLAAIALDNSRLYHRIEELAITDGLTGLFCSRYFKERLSEDILKAARIKQPLSLLMLDIDNFKDYNDKYGHIAGDIVLKSVADILKSLVDIGDLAARYGGEEFVLILFGKDKSEAYALAESIRRNIEAEKFILRDVETRVTASIGYAMFPEEAVLKDELIRTADAALYEAKVSGRNTVCPKQL
ncbi:MAG: sensor domain-containing diguanylate cyclase [Candidatus Omnitrophota bacterium]